MRVVVNGREVDVSGRTHVTYEEVVDLAGERGCPTVTYRMWLDRRTLRSGEMHAGCEPVELDDGVVFHVVHTDKA